jgi:hypothetical protein
LTAVVGAPKKNRPETAV